MSEESYSEYMIKGSTISFLALIATGIFGIVIRMLMSRALTVEEYGLFYAVFSFVSFLTILRSLGQLAAVNKFIPKFLTEKKFTKLKSTIGISLIIQLVASLIVGGIMLALSENIAINFFNSKNAIPIIRILSIWFILMAIVKLGERVFQSLKDIPSNRSVELLRMGSVFVILFLISYLTDLTSYWAAVGYLISSFLTIIWILIRLSKHKHILSKGKIEINKQLTKKLFLFGLPLVAAGFAGSITSFVDTLVITAFKTPADVGLYQVARPATRVLRYFGMALSIPLFPMISELWTKKDIPRLQETTYLSIKFSLILTTPAVIVFLAFPKIVINILFGHEYVAAATTLQVLSLTMVAVSMFTIFGKILLGIGKNVNWTKTYALAAALNFIGDLALIPLIGIEGAALAFLFSHIIASVMAYRYINKNIDLKAPIREVSLTILGGLLTLALIILLKIIPLSTWPKFFIILIPAGILYLIWVLRTEILERKDIQILKQAFPIPKKIKKIILYLSKK